MYSCIIPMGTHDEWTEESNKKFYPLKNIFDEVLIVGPDHSLKARLPGNFRRIPSAKPKIAHLLNLGAHEAKGTYLCFLHFDSDFDTENFARLRLSLKPETLFYFEFQFMDKTPALAGINQWFANFRADARQLPLGNQCYSMDKKSFFDAGAFSERLTSSEDAEFMRRWRTKGFQIRKAKGSVKSSGPEYFKQGWLKTTVKDVVWTFKFLAGKEPKEPVPHS